MRKHFNVMVHSAQGYTTFCTVTLAERDLPCLRVPPELPGATIEVHDDWIGLDVPGEDPSTWVLVAETAGRNMPDRVLRTDQHRLPCRMRFAASALKWFRTVERYRETGKYAAVIGQDPNEATQ